MVVTEPTWMRGLPSTARLDSKTVASIFGYASVGCVTQAATKGTLPKADVFTRTPNPRGVKLRYYWKVSTIRKEIIRRANER